LCSLANLNWSQETVSGDWATIKQERAFEFGCLPVVSWNGVERGQTKAVLRALGIKTGYYEPQNGYHADVTLEMGDSLFVAWGKYLFEKDEETKKKHGKNYIEVLKNFVEFHEG
jgi:hypothetical protein